MIAIQQIKSLVKKGESATVEFKKSTSLLRPACETLCAFLNNKGGTVLIGVNDRGEIIGQDVTNNTRHEIAKELAKIDPHPDIEINYLSLDKDKQIIVLSANSGINSPYVYDDRPFLRNQSTTVRMPREKYDRLLYDRKKSSVNWEELISNKVSITDLDKNRIQQIISIAIREHRLTKTAGRTNLKEILKKLNLTVDDQVTNAAIILFCKNENKQFIQSQLKLARFRGTNKREFIDNKAIQGNVFDLYEHAMNFLQNYLPLSGKIEAGNPFRVDTLAIPSEVLREALVNALCHRDYSSSSGSISLAIYDDRVEISNAGRLPNNIRVRDLSKKHESRPRNPLIAQVLYACKMIERWGRGTQDMIDFCKEAGNPKPKYVESTGNFTVILPLKEPIGAGYKIEKKFEITARQKEILQILEKEPLNSAQVVEKLKGAPSRRTVQFDLTTLEKHGLIKREGESKSLSWNIVK